MPGAPPDSWLERGRKAWPTVSLGAHAEGFAAHVRAVAADVNDVASAADSRSIEDLYLAFGCGRGVPAAVRSFKELHHPVLRRVYTSWRQSGVEFDDFAQAVYERILVGERPKILTFGGRGPLSAWVRMVASRKLADDARSCGALPDTEDVQLLAARMMPAREVAERFVQHQLRGAVQAAVESGLATLSAEQRLLLRRRFLHGLGLAELAGLYGVHRVTISKRLARARRDALEALRRDLQTRLATHCDVESVARLCLSQLELSLGDALR